MHTDKCMRSPKPILTATRIPDSKVASDIFISLFNPNRNIQTYIKMPTISMDLINSL